METGKIRVKKTLNHYNKDIFSKIMNKNIYGIPEIFFVGEEEEQLVIIEEYISGRNLEQVIREKGPLEEKEVSNYICQLCDIVENLHNFSPKIIHRDIKPDNIILTPEGIIKLIDYDAAKEYVQGKKEDTILMGTKEFAAPEQYGFMQSDERTDIYGIGVTLNYLLTGTVTKEKIYKGSLGKTISKATSLEPSMRYESVKSLKKALKKNSEWKFTVWKAIGLSIGVLAFGCGLYMEFEQPIASGSDAGTLETIERIAYLMSVLGITLYGMDIFSLRTKLTQGVRSKLFLKILIHTGIIIGICIIGQIFLDVGIHIVTLY